MRIVLCDVSQEEVASAFGVEQLPAFGCSVALGQHVKLLNATPDGARLIEGQDVTIIINLVQQAPEPDLLSDFMVSAASGIVGGVVTAFIVEKLKPFLGRGDRHRNSSVIVDGRQVSTEDELRDAVNESLGVGKAEAADAGSHYDGKKSDDPKE